MIDFENEIFTAVATEVRSQHPGTVVKGEYVRSPAEFPMTTISEFENVMVDELMDSSQEEKYSGLAYRLQVFSNKVGGKKTEAKAIFKTADKQMRGMGFRRITYSTTPEIYDSTIYSITATYEAIVDVNGIIYKR
mgnify:CR=1 FL=1